MLSAKYLWTIYKKKFIFFLYRDYSDQNYKQRIQEFLILLHERNRKRGTWNRTISIIWVITAPQQNIWGMFSFTWLNFHFVLSVFSPGLLLLQNIELKPNKMSYVFSRQMLMINKLMDQNNHLTLWFSNYEKNDVKNQPPIRSNF